MTIKAHFDGKVFIPDEPVDVEAGQEVTIKVVKPPTRGATGADMVRLLEADSEIKAAWDEIAAGRDSREVADQLRREAQTRRPCHDPD